ncbi:MAG: hypothetical protein EPO68_01080 [Planctomycetota bacterium]|nr:MAG: hypothetical protein EPO68_01080 [Planctomycetota bacterium]
MNEQHEPNSGPTPWLNDPREPPNAEEARLERALAPLRYDAAKRPLELGALEVRSAGRARGARRLWLSAAAAAALMLTGLAGWAYFRSRATKIDAAPVPPGEFELVEVHGTVQLGAAAARELVCGAGASARVRVGDIGTLTLEENSRLRLERGGPDGYHVYLEEGAVSASIFAAPRVFSVGTPSGLAVDLGCIYRTEVEPDGSTQLSVQSGRVSFEADGRHSLVPAGAQCRAFPGRGPSAPVWSDAHAELQRLALEFDALAPGAARVERMKPALAVAQPRDSLTLFHLLERAETGERELLVDNLLAGSHAGLDRARLVAKDAAELAALRDRLERDW